MRSRPPRSPSVRSAPDGAWPGIRPRPSAGGSRRAGRRGAEPVTNFIIGMALGILIGTTPFLIGNRLVRGKLATIRRRDDATPPG